MEVSVETLFRVIGEKEVELSLTRGRLAAAEKSLLDAAQEINRLTAIASPPDKKADCPDGYPRLADVEKGV